MLIVYPLFYPILLLQNFYSSVIVLYKYAFTTLFGYTGTS